MISLKKGLTPVKEIFLLIIFVFFLLIYEHSLVLALPPLPTEFYGHIRAYNYNGSSGEIVQAYDSNGVLCGSFAIVNSGSYGSLTCKGDDPETTIDEGASAGESISFKFRGGFTTTQGNTSWNYGVFQYVNLSFPVVYCGDNFCDVLYESYYTCPNDCPLYNGTTNRTFNITNGTGTPSEGEQGAHKKERVSPVGLTPWAYDNYSGINLTLQEGFGFMCQENWECSNWSECRSDGYQNRTCADKNKCKTFEIKPSEIQKCFYTPTCFDGIKNGLEEGMDCGGLCTPCITCFDGIQNCHDGSCEESVDCGGPCPKCPTCFDGIQNCHDGSCEGGVDCGGSCEKKCPGFQIPLPSFACKKTFNPFSSQSISLFVIILIIALGDIAYSKRRIKEIGANKELSDIRRAKGILSIRRRMYLFIFIILLIAVVLYLYYYFFIMCEIGYRFLWFLLILLFVSPLIIHEIIRYLEYTENKRLRKLEALLNMHYKQIENLVRMENENLTELEEEVADALYGLLEKPEYKDKGDYEEVIILKEIYKELILLFSKYKEKENPVANEKILCDDIYKIVENKKYKSLFQQDSNFVRIITKLKFLYKQYEEKQKLYDEMGKLESSKDELKQEWRAEETKR